MLEQRQKYIIAIFALLIIPITGLSIDVYVPSLPAVTHYFHTDKSSVQLTITTYMIGMAIMQLFGGSISDSFGRKKPYIIAMLIYIGVTFLVAHAKNIDQLLFLRFIQGASIGLTVVPMRSIITDLFEGRELYKWMSYLSMAWAIGPIIAPAIGGYLQHYFGWQANFYFLGIYSTIIFLCSLFYFPETSVHFHPFKLKQSILRYVEISTHAKFINGVMICGILYSFIILFGIVGSFLLQEVLKYNAIQFGHMALLMGFAWFLGTLTNRFFIDIPLDKKAKICLLIMFIDVLFMFIFSIFFPLNIYNILIPLFILLWMGGILFPNFFTNCVSFFPQTTASANALFGSYIFIIAGICGALGTLLKSNTEFQLAGAYLFLTIICVLFAWVYIKKDKVDPNILV